MGTDPTGDGFGVATVAPELVPVPDEGVLFCCGGGDKEAFGLFFINSVANFTLVGTRFNRMAPPADEGVVTDEASLAWLLGGLNGDESEAEVHGEGKGFSGETMEAEDDSDATAELRLPPAKGIFLPSNEELRNSEGRRCRGGLVMSTIATGLQVRKGERRLTWSSQSKDSFRVLSWDSVADPDPFLCLYPSMLPFPTTSLP